MRKGLSEVGKHLVVSVPGNGYLAQVRADVEYYNIYCYVNGLAKGIRKGSLSLSIQRISQDAAHESRRHFGEMGVELLLPGEGGLDKPLKDEVKLYFYFILSCFFIYSCLYSTSHVSGTI